MFEGCHKIVANVPALCEDVDLELCLPITAAECC
jgi:hypothetical protein